MKSITPKKSTKKYYLIAAAVIVLLVAGAFTYVYAFNGSIFGWKKPPVKDASINYNPPTEEQKQAGENTKDASLNPSEEQKPNNTNETPTPPSTPTPGSKSTVTLTITAANQNPPSLQIRTEIGALTSEGTCTLTLTKGAKAVTRTAGIQALPRISTCQGFDIPLSELSSGQWNVAVHFENSALTADTTKQITIQ